MPATSSGSPTTTGAEMLLDERAVEHPRLHLAVADRDDDLVGAGALGEPARGDARPVAGHLRLRAVGVPDRDLEPVVPCVEHFDEAVRIADVRADELGRQRPPQ